MMMVNFDFLSAPIRLDESTIQVLCIENQKLFRNVFSAFVSGETENENIVFSENFVPFKTKGNICIIDDFFGLSYSGTIIKKIYEHIEKYCNNEQQEETLQLKTHLINYMELVTKAFDYDFEFNYDVNLTELFKALELRPATDKSEILHTLLDYMLIINTYVPLKCFVLLNLHLYFTKDELALFYTDIINNHITVLVIENTKCFEKNQFEKIIVYDNDFCEIVENR